MDAVLKGRSKHDAQNWPLQRALRDEGFQREQLRQDEAEVRFKEQGFFGPLHPSSLRSTLS